MGISDFLCKKMNYKKTIRSLVTYIQFENKNENTK